LRSKITFFPDIPIGAYFVWGSGKEKGISGLWFKDGKDTAIDTKTKKSQPMYGASLRATQVHPDFEKGYQQFKDKYTELTNPDGTYNDDMESGMKAKAYSGLKEEGFLGDDERPCDCGSGLSSEWEYDGQGIPLCRACSKCKQKKLSKYRPEILKRYTQADVDEPIEPDGDDLWEMTSSGAAGGQAGGTIQVPAWGTKNKEGSPRAIKAAKKYGKVVKSIAEKVK